MFLLLGVLHITMYPCDFTENQTVSVAATIYICIWKVTAYILCRHTTPLI